MEQIPSINTGGVLLCGLIVMANPRELNRRGISGWAVFFICPMRFYYVYQGVAGSRKALRLRYFYEDEIFLYDLTNKDLIILIENNKQTLNQ